MKISTFHDMSPILFFIFCDEDIEELSRHVSRSAAKRIIDFSYHVGLEPRMQEPNYLEAHTYLSKADWEYIARSSVDLIKAWPYRRFLGRSIIDWLRLHDFSLWWHLEGLLYYNETSGFYDIVKVATLIRRIIDREAPCAVYVVDRGDIRTRVVTHILSEMGVVIHSVAAGRYASLWRSFLSLKVKTGSLHWIWSLRLQIQRYWRSLLYWWSAKHQRYTDSTGAGVVRVLLVSEQGNAIRSFIDHRSGRLRSGDSYYAGLHEMLLQDETVQTIELQLNIPGVGSRPVLEDIKCVAARDRDYVPIEAFKRFVCVLKSIPVRYRMRRIWEWLLGDADFRGSLIFDGIDLFPLLHKQFEIAFLHNAVVQWRQTEVFREALLQLRPDVVLVNRYDTAMIDACQLERVPLIEMEHGTWSRFPAVLLRYYQYEEKGSTGCERGGRLFPNRIAVWGSYMRDLLQSWNYPPERIAVTGYPGYDRLFNIDLELVRQFAREHNLDPMKKIVVYMTGNPWMELYQTPQEQVETARYLLQEIKKLEDVFLVIKVHQYDDVNLYRKLQSKMGVDWCSLVLQKCDTTMLIAASDVIVAKGSSTLLEAAIAGKAVIMVNFSAKPDMFEFGKYRIGPRVDTIGDFAQALHIVLYDDDARQQMAAARKTFVEEWAHNADGAASLRLATLLKDLARNNRIRASSSKV